VIQPHTFAQRDFADGNFGLLGSADGTTVSIFAAPDLGYVITPTLLKAEIVTIPRDMLPINITYSTTFHGPAVSCSDADSTTAGFVELAAVEWEASVQAYMNVTAFTPQPGFGPSMNGSFFNLSSVSPDNGGSASTVFQIDTFSKDHSRLYLRVRGEQNSSALISCDFYNASYTVDFDLRSNGQQSITADTSFVNWLNARNLVTQPPRDFTAGNTTLGFLGLVSQFGGKMVGRRITAYDPTLFGTTSIGALVGSPLMSAYAYNANTTFGLRTFADAVESLMQNLTIGSRYGAQEPCYVAGLQCAEDFLSKATVNATLTSFRNQYSYAPKDLYVAYGLSIAWALLCVALGTYAMIRNGASYSNCFSTTVRMAGLSDPSIEEVNRTGVDPLPTRLRKKEVQLVDETQR
jgi:hypothetical protein